MSDVIVGRDAEIRDLRGAVDRAAAGRAQVIGIEGPAGIGKSALLAAAVDRLGGWTLLRCHQDPSATRERLGALHSLFGDRLAETASDLLRTAGTITEIIEELDGPVCLAVEDAHWLDGGSAVVLAHLLRQAADLPLLVILTTRHQATPELESLARLAGEHGRGRWLRLEPLGRAAVGELLARHTGVTPDTPTLTRILSVTGGYPLYVMELTRRLRANDDPALGLSSALDRLRGATPDRLLAEQVTDAMTRSSTAIQAAHRAVSLGEELSLPEIVAVLDHLGEDEPRLRDILAPDLLMRTDRGTLRPRHAMIAQAIVEESTPDEVRSTHRALGEALSGTASLLHRVGAARSAEDDPSLVSDLLGGAVTHLLAGTARCPSSSRTPRHAWTPRGPCSRGSPRCASSAPTSSSGSRS